jgi:integrase
VVDHYPNGRNGKREREPFPSYEEASRFELTLKKHKTSPILSTSPRFQDVYEEYLLWAKTNLAPTTYATRERRLSLYIMPSLGKYRVKDLNQRLLDDYSRTVAKWTFHTDLVGLMALIKWMVKRNYAERLSFDPERPRGNSNIKPVPHPADLLAAIDKLKLEVHRVLLKMMLFTGLRWNEVSNLRWENCDFTSQTIKMDETESEQDFIYMPSPLFDWMTTNRKPTGYVFPGRAGKPYAKLWKPFREVARTLGCKFSSHTLRHASASYLYEQTKDLYQVQAHLRHKKITTTQIYARMSVERRRDAVSSVINYVDNQTTAK